MPGPWEKYAASSAPAVAPAEAPGPWSKYATQEPTLPTPSPSPASEPKMGWLEKQAKGVVEGLPRAVAAVGGVVGGTAAGSASMGIGALPGAVVGAGMGGVAGTAARDIIKSVFWPKEAPKDIGEAAVSQVTGGVSGALQEVVGQAIGSVIKVGSEAAGLVSKKIATSDIGSAAIAKINATREATGDAVSAAFQALSRPVGGAVAGGAVGYAVAGKEGAKVGAVVGALAGASQMGKIRELVARFKDPAAMSVPRITRETAGQAMELQAKAGRSLEPLYKEVEDILLKKQGQIAVGSSANEAAVISAEEAAAGEETVLNPFRTRADVSNEIERRILDDYAGRGESIPNNSHVELRRVLKNYFGNRPDELLTPTKMWATAKGMNARNPLNPDNVKLTGEVQLKLRTLLDEYVGDAGDVGLAQKIADHKDAYSKITQLLDDNKTILTNIEKEATQQAGKNAMAKMLSLGPEKLTPKYYKVLTRAMIGRGISGAVLTHANLMLHDKTYNNLIASLQDAGAASGQ
jgi:hypothetical protein